MDIGCLFDVYFNYLGIAPICGIHSNNKFCSHSPGSNSYIWLPT